MARTYPWHTRIVSTTFWVGEVFDPDADDGSQVYSTYDDDWQGSYGGCDGVIVERVCQTERRRAANGYFPTHMKPKENPFYLDVPYDDVNDRTGFRDRDRVVPWAGDPAYRKHRGDDGFSYLKNRWVQLSKDGRTCYGQVQDAGPGTYHDSAYVFGPGNERPANKRYNGAGVDVSPRAERLSRVRRTRRRGRPGELAVRRGRQGPERTVAPHRHDQPGVAVSAPATSTLLRGVCSQ
ncbi:hypothetical protein [Curtobacterium sp. MCPF17_052]|uniref:hypothetical protein n=1 Tax=Curtobacterium sp. MCPF17_052 TaxID=2175655 RepID=UPI0024DFFD31|nr:hypothetical protein [Curtobacterium sp. MCPF17_052]WIB12885.1 hypothetical protein DEJ36_02255 [Curtobacterium sp. MCPF17_052]